MSRRLLHVLLPLLAVVTGAFGLYQLFLAGLSFRLASVPFGLFYGVMGIAGVAIATALWRTWRGPAKPASER